MAKRKSKSSGKTMAQTADKFDLYQQSVQTPDHEVEFFEQAYREAYKRKPYVLREDFCGTFAVCCEWVATSPRRTAHGVDLCSETLRWGREHNLSKLKPKQQSRVTVLEQDVRENQTPPADVLAAQNFSFWLFKTRQEVVDYFQIARSNLNAQGILVMDMMGGGDCYTEELTDKRTIKKGKKGFAYHWTQESFNPITADAEFSISFKFPDGSKLKRAFEYQWRFWTIPEVREMLAEAGFRESHVYWEIEDEDNPELDGTWHRSGSAVSDPSWICYIVAIK
ncbi:hypothetical protein NHH03_02090 [Stieleria sp. TO1_6]|uniref:hypothetical protein n=1 Tax=Stieleria tagensis TaxID=2956795 RepID=UPI00209B64AE|nr:hypothetical protein [Stieleria tagensis]MCO8120512.1 hypothetical protein [Stieleria tagensis]